MTAGPFHKLECTAQTSCSGSLHRQWQRMNHQVLTQSPEQLSFLQRRRQAAATAGRQHAPTSALPSMTTIPP